MATLEVAINTSILTDSIGDDVGRAIGHIRDVSEGDGPDKRFGWGKVNGAESRADGRGPVYALNCLFRGCGSEVGKLASVVRDVNRRPRVNDECVFVR